MAFIQFVSLVDKQWKRRETLGDVLSAVAVPPMKTWFNVIYVDHGIIGEDITILFLGQTATMHISM